MVYFFSRSLSYNRSCERCNEALFYVIQLVVWVCNDFFNPSFCFLLSLHLVDNQVKNVDELGSEHHVRTHINEPPCTF